MRKTIVLIVGLALGQTAWGEARPKSYAEELQETRRSIQAELSRLPSLGTLPMSEVLQLKVENGDLAIQSQLKPSKAPSQVQIKGMSGPASVMVRTVGAAGWASMQFIHKDTQRPGMGLVVTTVMSTVGNIQVSQDSEREDQLTQVQLIQDLRLRQSAPELSENTVRLYIHRTNQETGAKLVELQLSASSFDELVRQHPKEVGEFLRPVFRDLQQEATVFAMEDDVAWQVLSPRAKLDPAVEQQVQGLVKQLGAEKAADREAAAEGLRKLGRPGILALMKVERGNLSAEQNAQIDVLLEPYRRLSKSEAEAMLNNVDFLLNTLASEDPALRRLGLGRLEEKLGRKVAIDIDAPLADRLKAIAELRGQATSRPAE